MGDWDTMTALIRLPDFVTGDAFDWAIREATEKKQRDMKREQSMQKAMIELKKKFGKNAVLKGMNLEEGGTTIERNGQIGGHKA